MVYIHNILLPTPTMSTAIDKNELCHNQQCLVSESDREVLLYDLKNSLYLKAHLDSENRFQIHGVFRESNILSPSTTHYAIGEDRQRGDYSHQRGTVKYPIGRGDNRQQPDDRYNRGAYNSYGTHNCGHFRSDLALAKSRLQGVTWHWPSLDSKGVTWHWPCLDSKE